MVTQPELSDDILKIKTEGFKATGADYVITSSPSCVMQITRGGAKVLYLSELLAMAYGVEADQCN